MNNIKLTNKGQDSYLKKQILNREFAPFMLFVGQEGAGKKDSAHNFANVILCDNEKSEPCNICDNCKLINSGNHPDLIKLDGEGTIKIAEIRQLQKSLYLKPYRANHKVAIIHDAHLMTDESANALLKILEEPPENSVMILISPDKTLLPETVVSRSQVVNFGTSNGSDNTVNEETQKDIFLVLESKVSLYERFSIVHKYAKDKSLAMNFLDSLEIISRESLLNREDLERDNIHMLEKVQDSRRYLQRNLAGKFVLENLVLEAANYKL